MFIIRKKIDERRLYTNMVLLVFEVGSRGSCNASILILSGFCVPFWVVRKNSCFEELPQLYFNFNPFSKTIRKLLQLRDFYLFYFGSEQCLKGDMFSVLSCVLQSVPLPLRRKLCEWQLFALIPVDGGGT